MPYAEDRSVHDSNNHLMELKSFGATKTQFSAADCHLCNKAFLTHQRQKPTVVIFFKKRFQRKSLQQLNASFNLRTPAPAASDVSPMSLGDLTAQPLVSEDWITMRVQRPISNTNYVLWIQYWGMLYSMFKPFY